MARAEGSGPPPGSIRHATLSGDKSGDYPQAYRERRVQDNLMGRGLSVSVRRFHMVVLEDGSAWRSHGSLAAYGDHRET